MTCAIADGLQFEVVRLGSVRQGGFVQRPLTIFCGPNNAGKTWTMYALSHFHSIVKRAEFDEDHEATLDREQINEQVSESLPYLFAERSAAFRRSRFAVVDGLGWPQLSSSDAVRPDVFLIPAERNGLHLLYRELSTRRTALLHHVSRPSIRVRELLRDVIRSRYATPIANYIDWLNDLPGNGGRGLPHFRSVANRLKRGVIQGTYSVEPDTGEITFHPYQYDKADRASLPMGLHLTSGSVKSLFGLWFYLAHQAEVGDVLMIDEPELNIHPENQRKVARLLATLVNLGLNVTVSTHSDYIVRELNNLIMLSDAAAEPLRGRYGYRAEEVLSPAQVGAYLFEKQTIKPFEISPEDGIYATTFDDVIESLNEVSNEIYYQIQEARAD